MKLVRWECENYKSIDSIEFDISGLEILIGRNNCGKSNIVEALVEYQNLVSEYNISEEWFSETLTARTGCSAIKFRAVFELKDADIERIRSSAMDSSIAEWFEVRSPPLQLEHEITISEYRTISQLVCLPSSDRELTYSRVTHDRDLDKVDVENTTLPGGETIAAQKQIDELGEFDSFGNEEPNSIEETFRRLLLPDEFEQLIRPSLNSWCLIDSFRKAQTSASVRIDDTLDPTGENLTQVLNTLAQNRPDAFAEISDLYADVMNGINEIRAPLVGTQDSPDTTIKIIENKFDRPFPLSSISAGSEEILILITKMVLSGDEAGVLIVEEPELHLHPEAQREIFGKMQEIAETNTDVIISTHSDTFVGLSDTGEILSVTRDLSDGGLTEVERVSGDQLDDHLARMGFAKEDVLQSSMVVFVEGPSDKSVFEEFAESIDRSLTDSGITLVPAGGNELLEWGEDVMDVLDRMRIPYAIIADSDGEPPSEVTVEYNGALGINPNYVFVLEQQEIESYLLESSRALSSFIDASEREVESFLEDSNRHKGTLDNLFREFFTTSQYSERDHAGLIARHFEPGEIPAEIIHLVERVHELNDQSP